MIDNIYKHNSRSYFDLYNAYIAAYPGKPTWMFKEMSGLFDFNSELMNRIATDILYPQTRESAYAFAARCDYSPVEADGATDTLTITLSSAKVKTLSEGYQVGGISPVTGQMVLYELIADALSGGTDTITAYAKQIKTIKSRVVATINNTDDFADYPIDGFQNIIKTSVVLTINTVVWTRVDNFDDSVLTDQHFTVIYQSSGRCRFGFGNGTTGAKPALNSLVYAEFETTDGLNGRMDAGEITINVGADSDISAVTNAGSSGGNDSESVAAIIRNARANARLRTIVWSKEDLEIAARQASSSVIKALGTPGVGTASIQIVISGGTTPVGAGLITIVDDYVTALTQFGVMPITVTGPTYNAPAISSTITIRTDYVEATVKNLTDFALILASCAYDNQVTEYYQENGISLCRTAIINVLWAFAFTADEEEALEFIIKKWIALLGTRDHRDWGQDLEIGDLWEMGNSLYNFGVDEFNMVSPLVNTVATAAQIVNATVVINVV